MINLIENTLFYKKNMSVILSMRYDTLIRNTAHFEIIYYLFIHYHFQYNYVYLLYLYYFYLNKYTFFVQQYFIIQFKIWKKNTKYKISKRIEHILLLKMYLNINKYSSQITSELTYIFSSLNINNIILLYQ